MLRNATVFALLMTGFTAFQGNAHANPVPKVKHIGVATTLIRSDGSIVVFNPATAGPESIPSLAAEPPTAADVRPCLAQKSVPFNCSIEDHKLATTDVGMGYHIRLDGVTPSYGMTWTNNSGGTSRGDRYEFDDRCNPGWYLDYGEPLAGDEVCWSSGSMDVYWAYPHSAGNYTYRGIAGGVLLVTETATVYPGTLEVISGDGQTTLINSFAQAPLVAGIRNYRGQRVNFPVNPEYPDRANPFVFSVTGPKNATGAGFDPEIASAKPGPDGAASIRVRVGDKPGAYSVTVSSEDTAPLTTAFALAAVTRKEPDDNKDKEEGDGEDCGVADPITIGIGNSFQQETDYAKTRLSLLEFTRSYNALGSKSSLMRNYWTTTFDRAVFPPAAVGAPTRVRRPDGRVIPFTLQGGVYESLRPYFQGRLLKASGSGWQYITEDNVTETYNAQGKWVTIVDAVGLTLSATYSSQGLLTKVTSNTGESLTFGYNGFNQISTATDHSGRVWAYTYNGYANLTQLREPDGVYRNYYYRSPHSPYLLTGIGIGRTATPDSDEQYVSWEFDAEGRATSNYYSGGLKRFDIAYNDITGERIVTDPLFNQSTFATRTISGRGFVEGVQGPGYASCGLADSEIERDSEMNVTRRTTFGLATQYGDYDAKGQHAFMIEAADKPDARRTDYTYDHRFIGKPTSISQPSVAPGMRKVTRLDYDPAGNVVQELVSGFRPDGAAVSRGVTRQFNGPYGQISQIDGPRTDVADIIRFDYSATTRRLLRVLDANGIALRSNITYTATGQIAAEDRPNELRVTYSYYSGTDLLKSVTQAGGGSSSTTTWVYNDRRLVTSLIIRDGVNADLVSNFSYSAAGDLVTITSPGVGEIRYQLDKAGNRTRESYKLPLAGMESRWIVRTFDAYGRLINLVNPGNQSRRDVHPNGTLTTSVDGNSNATAYTYDDFKRLTQVVRPGGVATAFGYDAQDRLSQVTDANQAATHFVYDDLGDRIRLESPDSGVTNFEHDGAGNLIRTIDALGQVTTFTYDPGNRLRTVDRVGTADDEVFAYDACANGVGRLCSITNGAGDIVGYEYTALGTIAKQTSNAGTVGYQYDGAGNITEIAYPSQRKVRYSYSSGGQTISVAVVDGGNSYVLARSIARLPFGPATSWTYGNGLTETRQYDLQYRPVSFSAGGRSSVSYDSYDGNSNPIRRTVNGDSQTLTYDPLGRLQTADGAFGSRSYGYDGVANRTSLSSDGQSTLYAYQPQSSRLSSDSHWAYSRDANGNETRRRDSDGHGWDLIYTANNRLLAITDLQDQNMLIGAYRYNALGQRTVKSTPYGDTRFVYGLSGELLAELLPDGSVIQEYVYLDGAPIALLGVPAAPAEPFGVDQIVDNPATAPNCSTKNASVAVNGKYLNCGMAGANLRWGWLPPVSGGYDVAVRWAWASEYQCYRFGGFSGPPTCVGSEVAAGTWVAAWASPPDRRYRGAHAGCLRQSVARTSHARMDAIRYVLVHKDLTDRDYKYAHHDALGTPLRVTDQLGIVVWQASHNPFGAATVNTDPDGNGVQQTLNLRFPGQYYDAETGLHYNYFRDYDPGTGRYFPSDPIRLAGGVNTFAYVGGEPTANSDPLGLWGSPGQQFGPNYSNNADRTSTSDGWPESQAA